MATVRTTPQGRANVTNVDVSLTSLQVRTLLMCLNDDKSFYDVVQTIREEPELKLIPQDTIAKDVANLAVRGLVVIDLEND